MATVSRLEKLFIALETLHDDMVMTADDTASPALEGYAERLGNILERWNADPPAENVQLLLATREQERRERGPMRVFDGGLPGSKIR